MFGPNIEISTPTRTDVLLLPATKYERAARVRSKMSNFISPECYGPRFGTRRLRRVLPAVIEIEYGNRFYRHRRTLTHRARRIR